MEPLDSTGAALQAQEETDESIEEEDELAAETKEARNSKILGAGEEIPLRSSVQHSGGEASQSQWASCSTKAG